MAGDGLVGEQLKKTKQLIVAQWERTIGKKLDRQREEALQLLDEHFEDAERGVYQKPQHLGTRSTGNKGLLSHLKPRDRALYVCKVSGAFLDSELEEIFDVSARTIQRLVKKASPRNE